MRAVLTRRKATPPSQEWQQLRALCQHDLYALAKVLLGYTDLTDGFHRPVARWWAETPNRRKLILLPRDHFKTSVFTIAANILRILRDPDVRILIASNKAANAEAMLRELKAKLTHPMLVSLFPDILWPDPARQAEQWTTSAITVKRSRRGGIGTVETIGAEGELTSKHYDHMTFDDLVGLENSQTRDQLLSTITWYKTSQGLAEPWTTEDIIGTPWHYADLYAWLREQASKGLIDVLMYRRPCWEERDGVRIPAFPERFPLEVLLERRRLQGPSIFAAQMLLDPIDEETAVFPRSRLVVVRRDLIPDPESLWCAMTVDPAISVKSWADYSAIAVGGFDPEGRVYLLDLRRGRWKESELLAQMYDAYARTPNIRVIGFEAVGFAKIFRRLLTAEGERRGAFLPAVALERDTRITKQIRIRGLEPWWVNGSLIAAADCPALEDFMEEAERFRPSKESLHDDLLDAVVDLIQLRATPTVPDATADLSMLEDPEVIERQQFEVAVEERRRRKGQAPLDQTSLRALWHQRKYFEAREQDRERGGVATTLGEFW